jgi:hypothetical protein
MTPFALREHLINSGRVDRDGQHYRLTIPTTSADTYVDAQLDDYEHTLPRQFTNHPPQTMTIRARFSHQQVKGTAGFGFWNHPFSREGAVIDPPCNVWFFYSSPESDLRVARGFPGHGFKASMLNSGRMPRVVVTIGSMLFNLLLRVPVISKLIMSAARSAVNTSEIMLNLDMTVWHEYKLNWLPNVATFCVDGKEILRAPHPPQMALGFAAWIDNYRASAGGSHYQFAYVAVTQEQWMELEIMDGDE